MTRSAVNIIMSHSSVTMYMWHSKSNFECKSYLTDHCIHTRIYIYICTYYMLDSYKYKTALWLQINTE